MRKSTLGMPVLLAAALALSACQTTSTIDSETIGDSLPISSEEASELLEEAATEIGDAADEVAEDNGADISDLEDIADSDDTADSGGDEEAGSVGTVPDNTPIKIDGSLCPNDKVNDRGAIAIANGETSAVVQQSVLRDETDLYTLNVEEGQRYRITIASLEDNAEYYLFEPSGASITSENQQPLSGFFEETGDHTFCISSTARNATYTMAVTVTDATPAELGQGKVDVPPCGTVPVESKGEIKFEAGSSSGFVQTDIAPSAQHEYTFSASSGQDYEIDLVSSSNEVFFVLYGPGGSETVDLTSDRGTLDETGGYSVCVYSKGGSARYDLELTIS